MLKGSCGRWLERSHHWRYHGKAASTAFSLLTVSRTFSLIIREAKDKFNQNFISGTISRLIFTVITIRSNILSI